MAKLQMQRVGICALKRDRKAILEKLQSLGTLEICAIEDDELEFMDTQPARQGFEKKARYAENALAVLNEYVPEYTSLFGGLAGKQLVTQQEFAETVAKRDAVLEKSRQLAGLHKEITEKRAAIVKAEAAMEALQPWLALDVPLDYPGTDKTAAIIGTMDPQTRSEDVYLAIRAENDELDAVDVTIINADKDAVYLCVICLKDRREQVENALRLAGFSRPANPLPVVPAIARDQRQAEKDALEKDINELTEKIKEYEPDRPAFKLVADYYRMRQDKYAVLGTLPQSERTFFIAGYMPARAVPRIRRDIAARYDCVLDVEDLAADEEAPVLLSNQTVPASVEGVVSSYGLPGRDDVDPSKVTAIFFIIFFGLMLSDAAYGALVFIACMILLKKFPRMSVTMRQSLRLFMYCGLSTIFWGVLFGGYFGDLINIVSRTFFGHEVGIKPLWFAPLDDPMKLLIFSMLFGVIHLYTGLGVKGYVCLKNKKYLDFFCDVVLWYLLLTGLILMLLPSQIFVSMAQMDIVFPPFVNLLAKGMAIAGALGILLMSGRASKNFGLRLALGAYDLYNITGWVSDVLSYSRLLALGLATGVIASVINQMGSMAGKSVLGVIVFVLAFFVGHLFNMGINLLGAYVHTCRLQYVEFFGKFYEGGGRPFNPFKENTEYYDIKEER